jgi:hypothetical protein
MTLADGDDDDDKDNMSVLSSEVASLTVSDGPLSIASSISSVRSLASGWSQVSHSAFERLGCTHYNIIILIWNCTKLDSLFVLASELILILYGLQDIKKVSRGLFHA